MSGEIDTINFQNPQQLALEVEPHFGSYKTWAAKSVKSILEQAEFSGNLDSAKSPFYGRLQSIQINNLEVQNAVTNLQQKLKSVYSSVATIDDFLSIEEFELALDVYTGEVLPS